MMRKKDIKARRKKVKIYFWSVAAIYSISQLFNTFAVCIDNNVLSYKVWNNMSLAKSETIIVISLICNTFIAWKVLPLMRKSLVCHSITVEAWFMLTIFEVIMCYRIFIIGFQT